MFLHSTSSVPCNKVTRSVTCQMGREQGNAPTAKWAEPAGNRPANNTPMQQAKAVNYR